MVDFVKLVGGPPDCSIIGFPERTSVVNAASVIGTLGHADEVDAIEGDGLGAHIMAANMGAVLSAGQLAGGSGPQVLRGLIFGFDLTKRTHKVAAHVQRETGRAVGPAASLVDAGNTIGATAAAGIALGLPRDQMEVALCLGAAMACGITPFARESGHMLKSFVRGGVGARNGVSAALMAKAGYDAPGDIFDGSQGFFHSRTGSEDLGPEFVAGLATDYTIQDVVFKRASAGGPNQAPRQGLVELMTENGLTADVIDEIQAEVPPEGFNTLVTTTLPLREKMC